MARSNPKDSVKNQQIKSLFPKTKLLDNTKKKQATKKKK